MIATRAFRLALLPTLVLAASLGTSHLARAQATKVETKTKVAKEKAKADEKVDLNSASFEDLQTLPGVGEVTARKIIDSRPHKAVTDLASAGVSASEIEKLKPLVEVKSLPEAVDVNTASVEKLESLPGITANLAKEIVAARPHDGYDSIAKLKGIGPVKLDGLKGRVKFADEPEVAKAKAKAKAKVAEAKVEEAKAEAKVEEAKTDTPKAKAKAKMEEVAAKAKVAEAKVEEKVKTKVAEEKEKAKPKSKLAAGEKININTASKEELDELFDIGEVKSQAIIDYRKETKFETIEDIMKVRGIKEGIFAKIKDQIKVK